MPFQRDPVSEQFDQPAARLIRRAHATPGRWRGTYIANPGPAWVAWGAQNGIRLLGADTATAGMARTRWCRAFVRSVYYLYKNFYYEGRGLDMSDKRLTSNDSRAVQFQVGGVRIARGGVVVGRLVRIRMVPGGGQALHAVEQLPDDARIWEDDGHPGGRFAWPELRDWA